MSYNAVRSRPDPSKQMRTDAGDNDACSRPTKQTFAGANEKFVERVGWGRRRRGRRHGCWNGVKIEQKFSI
jgi:hypothetical protein